MISRNWSWLWNVVGKEIEGRAVFSWLFWLVFAVWFFSYFLTLLYQLILLFFLFLFLFLFLSILVHSASFHHSKIERRRESGAWVCLSFYLKNSVLFWLLMTFDDDWLMAWRLPTCWKPQGFNFYVESYTRHSLFVCVIPVMLCYLNGLQSYFIVCATVWKVLCKILKKWHTRRLDVIPPLGWRSKYLKISCFYLKNLKIAGAQNHL